MKRHSERAVIGECLRVGVSVAGAVSDFSHPAEVGPRGDVAVDQKVVDMVGVTTAVAVGLAVVGGNERGMGGLEFSPEGILEGWLSIEVAEDDPVLVLVFPLANPVGNIS